MNQIPKIGFCGWLGVVVFFYGLVRLFNAHAIAENLSQPAAELSMMRRVSLNEKTLERMQERIEDDLEVHIQKKATSILGFGIFLVSVGYRRNMGKEILVVSPNHQ